VGAHHCVSRSSFDLDELHQTRTLPPEAIVWPTVTVLNIVNRDFSAISTCVRLLRVILCRGASRISAIGCLVRGYRQPRVNPLVDCHSPHAVLTSWEDAECSKTPTRRRHESFFIRSTPM
jgi:hypothetical protein